MVKVYLESKDEKLYEITINEFIKNTSKFSEGKITKNNAVKILEGTVNDIYHAISKESPNKIWTIVLESEPVTGKTDYKTDYAAIDLLQQFIIYYANLLNTVLCQKALNSSYVKATGNPATTDINLYGVKIGNNSIIIKSFIFGTVPEDKELYISTTCGTGGTSTLFEKLKEMIADRSFNEPQNNKIKYIHLESIEKVNTISFYSKLQFYKTNKDTKNILKDMINNVYKKDLLYDEYIRKSNLDIGGSMYWSDDKKVLKKLKCSYTYEPELWYKNINKLKNDGVSKPESLNYFLSKYQDLKGAGIPEEKSDFRRDKKEGYDLHAVVIHKPINMKEAKDIAKEFIKHDRNFFRETKTSFRFRNVPKQKFERNTFRSKKINPSTTLIYGKLLK